MKTPLEKGVRARAACWGFPPSKPTRSAGPGSARAAGRPPRGRFPSGPPQRQPPQRAVEGGWRGRRPPQPSGRSPGQPLGLSVGRREGDTPQSGRLPPGGARAAPPPPTVSTAGVSARDSDNNLQRPPSAPPVPTESPPPSHPFRHRPAGRPQQRRLVYLGDAPPRRVPPAAAVAARRAEPTAAEGPFGVPSSARTPRPRPWASLNDTLTSLCSRNRAQLPVKTKG